MKLFFFIKINKEYKRVNYADICYVEARRNYVKIITRADSYLCLASMLQVESILPKDQFCRIHKTYIIAINNIEYFERGKIYVQGYCLPIGDHYWKGLLKSLTVISCGSVHPVKLQDAPNFSMTG